MLMAKHIDNLQVKTYRGIKHLNIDDLGDVNIFVGDNNAGKTSVLEAIKLLCIPNEFNLLQVARQRERYRVSSRLGLSILDSILFLFDVNSDFKANNTYALNINGSIHNEPVSIEICGELLKKIMDYNEFSKYAQLIKAKISNSLDEGDDVISTFVGNIHCTSTLNSNNNHTKTNITHFEINDYSKILRDSDTNKFLNVTTVQTIDHITDNAFSKLIKNKEIKKQAVELLKEFDSSITDLRYINDENRFVPVIESDNDEYIPLSLYGDGMKKALTMLNAMVNTENGVVLIDEFETALHTSAMKKVFKFMLDIAKLLNIQLFLTTHSIEAVDKLLESSEQYIEKIRVIRLKKKKGTTYAKISHGNDALYDRKEYDMELRI